MANLSRCGGVQVLAMYDQIEFELLTDKYDPRKFLEKIEEYCNPRQVKWWKEFSFEIFYLMIPLEDKLVFPNQIENNYSCSLHVPYGHIPACCVHVPRWQDPRCSCQSLHHRQHGS